MKRLIDFIHYGKLQHFASVSDAVQVFTLAGYLGIHDLSKSISKKLSKKLGEKGKWQNCFFFKSPHFERYFREFEMGSSRIWTSLLSRLEYFFSSSILIILDRIVGWVPFIKLGDKITRHHKKPNIEFLSPYLENFMQDSTSFLAFFSYFTLFSAFWLVLILLQWFFFNGVCSIMWFSDQSIKYRLKKSDKILSELFCNNRKKLFQKISEITERSVFQSSYFCELLIDFSLERIQKSPNILVLCFSRLRFWSLLFVKKTLPEFSHPLLGSQKACVKELLFIG